MIRVTDKLGAVGGCAEGGFKRPKPEKTDQILHETCNFFIDVVLPFLIFTTRRKDNDRLSIRRPRMLAHRPT